VAEGEKETGGAPTRKDELIRAAIVIVI